MDKSNRKLKILYKCIKANTSAIWQHRLHIPPTKKHEQIITTADIQLPYTCLVFKWTFNWEKLLFMKYAQNRQYSQLNGRINMVKMIANWSIMLTGLGRGAFALELKKCAKKNLQPICYINLMIKYFWFICLFFISRCCFLYWNERQFLFWEIGPPYLGKTTAATRYTVLQVHAGSFCVSVIHRTMTVTWTYKQYKIFNVCMWLFSSYACVNTRG